MQLMVVIEHLETVFITVVGIKINNMKFFKKNFLSSFCFFLFWFILFLPELKNEYKIFQTIYNFGIIKVFFILLFLGLLIDFLINRKEADFIKNATSSKIIFLLIFVLTGLLGFSHIF